MTFNEKQQKVEVLIDYLLRKYDDAFHQYCEDKSVLWYEISQEIYTDIIYIQTSTNEDAARRIKEKIYF